MRECEALLCFAGWISAQASSGGNRAFGGAPGTRRALAWYPEKGTDTNVTVIITNVVRCSLACLLVLLRDFD
jgi:hypothetical protein